MGYRSRAAFKLIEIDDKFHLLKKAARVVDLGAAPGGWTQVAVQRAGNGAKVIGLDISEMEDVPGAEIIVRMAQTGPDGPTGGYFDRTGPVPW